MESAHHSLSRPDRNNTADVPSFTLHTALSAIPFVSDLCGVDVQWFQERSSQDLPNSKELSVYMTWGFLFGSKNFCKLLCVSWEVFVLHGYDWIHWVAKSCTTTAYRWYCVIHFLHWELCDPQLLNHQNFLFWARLYQHVFCKKPLFCSSSSRYRSLGLSGSECRHCAYPSQVPLLLATPMVIHEKNWKCLDPWAPGFPVTLKDYFHRTNFLWTPVVSPASHAKDRFVLLRVLHVYFCFRFLSVYAAGFPVTPLSYFHFIRVLDFRCICLTRR